MASNYSTITEGLSNDQIKRLSTPYLTHYLEQFLIELNAFPEEEQRNEIIDQIIQEGKVPDNLNKINAEKKLEINKEISERIKEAKENFKEALNGLKPHGNDSYYVVTINMNGTNEGGVTQHRRNLINIILLNIFPAVVFCQELPGHFERMVNRLTVDNHWDFVRVGREAGIIWDKKCFQGTKEGFRSTDRRMITIRDNIQDHGASNLLSRAAFVKLTINESSKSFIAVSYHGEYRVTDSAKIRQLNCLIEFVQKLSGEEGNIPFLIGGDFNFNTLEVNIPNIVFPYYEMTDRATRPGRIPNKDNFCWGNSQAIKIFSVKPFDFGSNSDSDLTHDESFEAENDPDANQHGAEVEDLLDHDPVFGILKLCVVQVDEKEMTTKMMEMKLMN